jgi:hydrogenase-4 component F
MELLLWLIPVVALALLALPLPRRVRHAVSLAETLGTAIVAGFATWTVLAAGTAEPAMPGNLFYLDAVSAILLDLVALVGLLTSLYTVGYVEEEIRTGRLDPKKVPALYLLIHGFLFTMVLTLTLRNLGGIWIAIEATTLASVFLVGFHNGKAALEAAWKYIILCSVGIALAMLGIVFLNSAAQGVLPEGASLDWTALFGDAASLDASYLKFAFIFLLIGFGTKAGLAPMHNWLPDAHSQAPSPVSALLSGVLLNAAMYAILRTAAIVNRNLGDPLYTGRLLVVAGVLSVATAAVFLLTQKDYKRLLAYSSIEHMGLVAIGVGLFTPLSLFAAFYHMINHSLTKSLLFLSSGTVLQKTGTRDIGRLGGLLRLLPVTGPVFLLGLVAIGGTPPFSLFASELALLTSIFQQKRYVLGAAVALLLSLVFAGIVQALFRVFYPRPGVADADVDAAAAGPGEPNRLGAVAVVALLVLILVTGVFLPPWLTKLIDAAQRILSGQGGD